MTNEQKKRVEVAKDVIALVNSGVLHAGHRGYINPAGGIIDPENRNESIINLMTIWTRSGDFKEVVKQCTVCALGAVTLASLVKREDEVKAAALLQLAEDCDRDIVDDELMCSVFSEEQMDLIESAYEQCAMGDKSYSTDEDTRDAVIFGKDHSTPSNRLIAIMQNIIDHKGEFKPAVRYDVVISYV
jgi:hypothetical protein